MPNHSFQQTDCSPVAEVKRWSSCLTILYAQHSYFFRAVSTEEFYPLVEGVKSENFILCVADPNIKKLSICC